MRAANRLFDRHGIKKVTVEEVCRTAEISKMTFYKYYRNKTALVQSLWDGWVDEGLATIDEIDRQNIPLPEKIEMMFAWKSRFLSNLSAPLASEIIPMDLSYDRVIQRFVEFIIHAQERNEIRATIRPAALIAILNNLYEMTRDDELRSQYDDMIELNRELKDFFWYGVVSR